MKASRQEAERLLAKDPGYCDAWVAIGVENYMLSVKPFILRLLLRAAGGEADRARWESKSCIWRPTKVTTWRLLRVCCWAWPRCVKAITTRPAHCCGI